MTAITPNIDNGSLLTRRSIFIGAAAALICAPAIVRITNLMPVRRIILRSDHYYGFVDRLRASQYFSTIIEGQSAGLSANEIAAEMNTRRNKPPNYAWPRETAHWDARCVFEVIRSNEGIRRSDSINRALRTGALVYASDFPDVAPIEKYLADEKDLSNG
jgi:hypothetical protein